jgi:hypothetical protein
VTTLATFSGDGPPPIGLAGTLTPFEGVKVLAAVWPLPFVGVVPLELEVGSLLPLLGFEGIFEPVEVLVGLVVGGLLVGGEAAAVDLTEDVAGFLAMPAVLVVAVVAALVAVVTGREDAGRFVVPAAVVDAVLLDVPAVEVFAAVGLLRAVLVPPLVGRAIAGAFFFFP